MRNLFSEFPKHLKYKTLKLKNPETMEANKKALESLEANGEQVIVDYMGKSPYFQL